MTFRHHLPKELRWSAIGKFETGQTDSVKNGYSLRRVPMTDICHQAHERTELLNSDPLSLQALEGWYQGQPCVHERSLYGRQPAI
ncbi:hypothetical protein TNCV_2046901 [Trichonephila clavipes]|uniref:Uncharacterized protein n=1 Tax=Trichonephila clavipes TaxID=2585209 RepID=A0A8X6SQV3_TRICX|nr:hypothetical protein TNCV_2046901 [Trichonephila clavipes]